MKKTILLLLVSAFFIGCSDDGTTPEPTNNNNTSSTGIVGVWNFESIEQDNGLLQINGTTVSTFTAKSSNEQGTFEFKSDGTATNTIAYTSTTTFMTNGVSQEQTASIPMTTSNGTYVYNKAANTITITDEQSEETEMEIIEHTSSKLVMKSSFSDSTTEMGITSTSSGDVIITLSK